MNLGLILFKVLMVLTSSNSSVFVILRDVINLRTVVGEIFNLKLPLPVNFKALHKHFGRGSGVELFAGIIVVEVYIVYCVL